MSRRQFGTVRHLPSGKWQVGYRDPAGRRITAADTFDRKGDAAACLAAIETDQLRGAYIDPRAGQMTVRAWAEEWMATKRGQRANTLARDRAALAHALPLVGNLPLVAVTPAHVRQVVDAMRAADLSAKSVRTYVGTLSGLFSGTVEADRTARSPVRPTSLNLAATPAGNGPP